VGGGADEAQGKSDESGERTEPKLLVLGAGRDFIHKPVVNVSSGRHPLTYFFKKVWKSRGPKSIRRKSGS
jgi:hypothetical protein